MIRLSLNSFGLLSYMLKVAPFCLIALFASKATANTPGGCANYVSLKVCHESEGGHVTISPSGGVPALVGGYDIYEFCRCSVEDHGPVGPGDVEEHTIVSVTPVPDSGYRFVEWEGTGVPSGLTLDDPLVLHMDRERIICPVFEPIPLVCTLDLTILPELSGGGMTIQPLDSSDDPVGDPILFGPAYSGYPYISGDYDCGTKLKLTPGPEAGWYFMEWSGVDSSDVIADGSGTYYTIILDGDKTITAEFDELFTLTLDIVGEGVVRIVENGGDAVDHAEGFGPTEYPSGTSFMFQPFPIAGNEFVGWSGAITTTSGTPQSLMLTEDMVVAATFRGANHAPEISLTTSSPYSLECGGLLPAVSVSDVDEPSGGSGLPVSVVVLNESSNSVEISTALQSPGSYTVSYTVTDSRGASASVELELEVIDSTPPTIEFDPEFYGSTMTVNRKSNFTLPVATADDVCAGTLPVVSSGVLDLETVGSYVIAYTAEDDFENTTTFELTVHVVDAPPVVTLTGPATMLVKLGSAFIDPGATALDVVDGTLPVVVSGSVNTSVEGDYTLYYSATDSYEQTSTAERLVTVSVDYPPVIVISGDNPIVIPHHLLYNDLDVWAEDDFTDDAVVTARMRATRQGAITTLPNGTYQKGTYAFTYSTYDDAQNISEELVREVVVVDTLAPTITLIGPAIVDVDVGEDTYTELVDGTYVGAQATDLHDGNVAVTSDLAELDTSIAGVHLITYRAEDAEGNEATKTRTIRVGVDDPPIITLVGDASVTVPFGLNYVEPDPGATAMDSVDGDLTDYIVVSGLTTAILGGPGIYEIDYDVEDFNGNAATTVTRVVTKEAPTPMTLAVTRPVNGTIELTPPEPAAVVDSSSAEIETFAYDFNTIVQARAIPDTGFVFVGWGGDLSAGGRDLRFEDTFDFSPLDDEWNDLAGAWTVESGYLKQGTSGTAIGRVNAFADMELRFSYLRAAGTNDLAVVLRETGAGDRVSLVVGVMGLSLVETVSSTPSVLDENIDANSAEDAWYNLFVELDGALIRVWRKSGEANFDLVLSSDTIQVLETEELRLETSTGGEYHFDNFTQKSLHREGTVTLNQNRAISAVFRAEDTTPPTITLLGASPYIHECGTVFNDPGVTVADDTYGYLLGALVVSGDTIHEQTAPGTYEIVYRVTDPEGNSSQLVRVVEVVDSAPPVITLTGESHIYLALNTYQYFDAGAIATDGCDDEVIVAVDTSAINLNVFGVYTVTFTAEDSSGNQAIPVERTVSVAPTLTIEVVDGGRVEPGGGGAPIFYDYGTEVPVRAIPGAAFDHWMGGGFDNETDDTITVVMTQSRHLTAYFKPMAFFEAGVLEFGEDAGKIGVPVLLNRVSTQNITLQYEIIGGSARYGVDFTHPAGTVFSEWRDDFSSNSLEGWTGASTWSAQRGYLENTGTLATVSRMQAEGDFDLYFKYLTDRTSKAEVTLRKNLEGDAVVLSIEPSLHRWSLRETVDSTSSYLASATSTTAAGIWYDVFVAMDGATIEVWRAEPAMAGAYTRILGPTSSTVIDSDALEVTAGLGTRFDEFDLAPPVGKGEIIIPTGELSGVIEFDIVDDASDEPIENVEVALIGGSTGFIEPSVKTWSILDNDAEPSVAFDAPGSSVSESGGLHRIKVVLSEKSGHAVELNYAVSGTAVGAGVDYDALPGSLTLSPESPFGYIDVFLVDDQVQFAPGYIEITLTGAENATLGALLEHTVTILDDDYALRFNTPKTEVSESVGSVAVEVVLPVPSPNEVNVGYFTSGGTTATGAGTDFTLAPGTLTFAPNDQSETITLEIEPDSVSEALEKIEISLRSPVNAVLGEPRVHTIEIADDDSIPAVGFSEAESSLPESAGDVSIPVIISNVSEVPVSVSYIVTESTATGDGEDYRFLDTGTIVIPAGSLGGAIGVRIQDDVYDEPDETITIELLSPSNATINAAAHLHVFTIEDNDGEPTVSIATTPGTHIEGNGDTSFELVLSSRSNVDVSVSFVVSGGTATGGLDHNLSGNTVSIDAGTLRKTVQVPIINDTVDEETESILLELTGATHATLSPTGWQGQLLIQDDDGPPSVQFSSINNAVPEDVGEVVVDATLSAASERTIVLPYHIEDIGTTVGLDYRLASGLMRDWSDDFNDGNMDGWSIRSGAWGVGNAILEPVGAPGEVVHHFFGDNFEFRFSYRRSSAAEVANIVISENISDPDADTIRLALGEASLRLFNTVDETEIAATGTVTVPGTVGVWYEVTIRREGSNVTVYQRVRGVSGEPALYLDADDILLGSLDGMAISADAGLALDDIVHLRTSEQVNRGQLVFTPGYTQAQFRLEIEDDDYYELNESMAVKFDTPTFATLNSGASVHTLTILDNEDAPVVGFVEATSTVTESAGSHSIPVIVTPQAGTEIRVDYEHTDGTALDQIDFADANAPEMLQWHDDFTDMDLLGWKTSTGWSATSGYLENASASSAIGRANTLADYQLTFRLDTGATGTAEVRLRSSGAEESLDLSIDTNADLWQLSETTLAGTSLLAEAGVLPLSGWIDVYVNCSGPIVDVWSKAEASSGPMQKVFSSAQSTIHEAGELKFLGNIGVKFDDISQYLPAAVTAAAPLFSDDFEDADLLGWTVGNPAWTAINHYLETTPYAPGDVWGSIIKPFVHTDLDLMLSYYHTLSPGMVSQITFRQNSGAYVEVKLSGLGLSLLEKTTAGPRTPIAGSSITASAGVWYDLLIRCEGALVQVWRKERGIAGPYAKLIEQETQVLTPGKQITIAQAPGMRVDDIYVYPVGSVGISNSRTGGTIAIPPHTDSASIELNIVNDSVDESNETATFNLRNPQNAALGAYVHTVTIEDDDETPTVAYGTSSTISRSEGGGAFVISTKLSEAAGNPVDVNFTITGTATLGTDFTVSNSGFFTYNPGITTFNLTITPINDSILEETESITLTLMPIAEYAVLGAHTSRTILLTDDDLPMASFAILNSEWEEHEGTALIEVTLSAPYTETVTVDYSATGGTATGSGVDYTLVASELTFTPGDVSEFIEIDLEDDLVSDSGETIEVTIAAGTNSVLGSPSVHTVTLLDALNDVHFAAATSFVTEPASTTPVNIPVTLESAASGGESVDYAVIVDGTDADGDDYTLAAGTLVFAMSDTEKDITIDIHGDSVYEGDETVVIELSNASSGLLLKPPFRHTLTIEADSDALPAIQFALANSTEAESDETIEIALTLSETEMPASVNYAVGVTSSANAEDFLLLGDGTIVIPAGETPEPILVMLMDDMEAEINEFIVIFLSDPEGATLGDNDVHTVTITDNDIGYSFSADSSTHAETAGTVEIPVILSGPSVGESRVAYSVSLGASNPATSGQDFTPVAMGELVFIDGETEPDDPLELTILDDELLEGDETLTITLSNPNLPTVVAGEYSAHTVIIEDNEIGVAFEEASSNVGENVEGGIFQIPVSLSEAFTGTVEIEIVTEATTATDEDVELETAALSFSAAGPTTQYVTLTILNDALNEAPKSILLELKAPDPAPLVLGNQSQHLVQLLDDDEEPELGFDAEAPVSVIEGETTVQIPVSLSAPSARQIQVRFTVSDGTATSTPPNADYLGQPVSGMLEFPLGTVTQHIPIQIFDDSRREYPDETLTIALSELENAVAGDLAHTLTILDNDKGVYFDASSSEASEGGNTPHLIRVRLTEPSVGETRVTYHLEADSTASPTSTATSPKDYSLSPPISGAIVFADGVSEASISLSVQDDIWFEDEEKVHLKLSGASPNTVGVDEPRASHTVHIMSNDPLPVLGFVSTAPTEVGESNSPLALGVAISRPSQRVVKATYATADGTATAPGDYAPASGTVTFQPGETEKTIYVPIIDDQVVEEAETLAITLSALENATEGTLTHTASIIDNELAVAFSDDVAAVDEGAGSYAVLVEVGSPVVGESVTVQYRLLAQGTTATPGVDFSVTNGSLTIPEGATTPTDPLVVGINEDTYEEDSENVVIELYNPINAGLGSRSIFVLTIQDNDSGSINNPDLAVEAITAPVEGLLVKAGDSLSTDFTLSNPGGMGSAATVSVYLSQYATLGGGPARLLKRENLSVLNAGESRAESVSLGAMPDVAPGSYYLIVHAAPDGSQADEDTANNETSVAIVVIDKVLTNE